VYPSEDNGSGFQSAIRRDAERPGLNGIQVPRGAVDHAEVTGWVCNVATYIPAPPELDET
jgi:hypothetical protein